MIRFVYLKAQYDCYKDEIDDAIHQVIDTNQFIMGNDVHLLNDNLSQYVGHSKALSCSNGTDALMLALMATDIKPGDEVITTPFTFVATGEVIARMGAKPVFVDIEEDTCNIDVRKIEKAITERTKAIIPVSIFGQPSDMDEINLLGDKYNLTVIEDGAQSFGAEYKGRKSCTLSKIACISFFPAKPLGCFGDGGAVFTNDDDIYQKMKSMQIHGQTDRYVHKYIGINARMDTIQAAVVNVKLKYFNDEIKVRQNVADRYTNNLSENIVKPSVKNDRTSVWGQYSIRIKNRAEIQKKLSDAGIPTVVHYPKPLHLQQSFEYFGGKIGDFPVAEKVCEEILSLPMSAFMKEEVQEYIIEMLNKFTN